MNLTGNTILITGGGSGIGRGLAEAFHSRGNTVIIAGRRKAALDETTAVNPGMVSALIDVADRDAISTFASGIIARYPDLNVLINNAGIMRAEDLNAPPHDLADAEATVATNLLGPIRLTAALLPHLRARPAATIINVSSGLAFVPMTATPTYSATKAAIHSYTQSLRAQLRETSIQVIELVPPGVATDLMPSSRTSPHSMPLDDYIEESMALFAANPSAPEICVERVGALRNAEANGQFGVMFNIVNGAH